MSLHRPLDNLSIAVTRPLKQATSFSHALREAGANVISFPLIEIQTLEDIEIPKRQLEHIGDYDLLIFVSANAVDETFKIVTPPLLADLKIAAIGAKTSRKLNQYGVNVDFFPTEIFNSEALLTMDDFRDFIGNSKIAIIRGVGGREKLRKTLLKCAAKVDYIDVYRRVCPQQDLHELSRLYADGKLDMIVFTSGTSIRNFFDIVAHETWINKIKLVVGSDRMVKQLPPDFDGTVIIADDPSDTTLFDIILNTYG